MQGKRHARLLVRLKSLVHPQVELPLVVGETDTIEHCEEMLATDHDSYPVVASRPDNMQVVGLMRRATMIKALKAAKSREDRTVNFGRMMELCPWMVPDTMPANRAYKVDPDPEFSAQRLNSSSRLSIFDVLGPSFLTDR